MHRPPRRWHRSGFRQKVAARERDESGLTLAELTIAAATLLILFAMTVPIIDTLFSTIARVNNTYTNVDQLLPVSTNLQRFFRSAVEPAPTSGGTPVPPFVTGAVTPTSVTFYTNVGDTNGPAEIVASCQSTTPSTGLCNSGGVFTVTEALANSGTCPPTGSGCTYGTAKTLITVDGVSNAKDDAPLFLYTLLVNTSTSSGTTITTTEVGSSCPTENEGNPTATLQCYYSSDTAAFDTCTASTSDNLLANCQGAEIYALSIDLQVNGVSTGRTAGGQSEDNSTVYLLSPESSNYQPMVG
ncbi:MAG: hypothetical protein ACRDVW_11470 [Acidimicrobiales bacterium]